MTSERARKGGGKEVAIAQHTSPGLTVSYNGNEDFFGPGKPMSPTAPANVAGRAFDFPSNYNTTNTTRSSFDGISFPMLRAFADGYDLLRLVIEKRKDAMGRLRWVIQPRDSKEKLTAQKRNKIKEITKFWLKPDGEHSWNAWLRMILEDLFVIDAATLHRRRTRGGKLVALDQIDGATVRRVIDYWGRTPEGVGEVAYQQVLKGMPALDYTRDEIMYMPRNLRVHKVYGYSPVEQIMMTINIGLRRQVFQLNFFTEGNMPASLVGVPETWTPDQIRTFQEWFDNINSGNLAQRSKARFVPSAVGKTYIPTQETELFGKAEEWLARVVCFAFSISPQPFLQMMNRATADTAQEEAAATGLNPIQNWVKDMVDTVLAEDMDAADLEFVWKGDDELDPTKRQQITSGYLKDGMITMNEGRIDAGREPYDDPIFDQPMFMTSNGLAPLTLTAQAQGEHNIDQNGKTIEDEPTPEDEAIEEINKLIGSGDIHALSSFLKEAIGGSQEEGVSYE